MLQRIRPGITYANVMATVAVFVALGGGAYAAIGKDSVKAKQIATNAVGALEIATNAVGAKEIKTGAVSSEEIDDESVLSDDLGIGAVGSSEIADGSIGGSDLSNTRVNGSIPDGTSNTFFIGEGTIGSADIGNGSVRMVDLAPIGVRGSVGTPTDGSSNTFFIGESSVGSFDLGDGTVRRIDAHNDLGFNCPAGTQYFQAACIETSNRGPATFDAALATCVGLGRWLPDVGQLRGFGLRPEIALDVGFEWGGAKYYDRDFDTADASTYRAPVIGEGTGGDAFPISASHHYRCVAPALGT